MPSASVPSPVTFKATITGGRGMVFTNSPRALLRQAFDLLLKAQCRRLPLFLGALHAHGLCSCLGILAALIGRRPLGAPLGHDLLPLLARLLQALEELGAVLSTGLDLNGLGRIPRRNGLAGSSAEATAKSFTSWRASARP